MAFKTMTSYNEAKYKNIFSLRNHGDSANVIFLYRSEDDVLVADTHYIKSDSYSGYVHCCGKGCPACNKGLRVQTKLFIPLYNIDTGEIQFWDRTLRFEPQLNQDVFRCHPNPSTVLFRITRNGVAGDVNTTYQITGFQAAPISYEEILQKVGASFPEYYSNICRDYSPQELFDLLEPTPTKPEFTSMPSYQVTPRNANSSPLPLVSSPPPVATPMSVPDIDISVGDTADTELDTDDPVEF